jgi:hypothetical protein
MRFSPLQPDFSGAEDAPPRIRTRRRENSVSAAKKVWAPLIIIGLAACTVAVLVAPASGQDLRRDGSKAVPFVADVSKPAGPVASGPVLRRDGSKAVPFVAELEPDTAAAADGFDWGDAALGAAVAIGTVALAGVGLAVRGRRVPNQASVQRPRAKAT